jgi:hypothetical protein
VHEQLEFEIALHVVDGDVVATRYAAFCLIIPSIVADIRSSCRSRSVTVIARRSARPPQ